MVLSGLDRPYQVLYIIVVLLQMVGGIFGGGSPNPAIASGRELHPGVKPCKLGLKMWPGELSAYGILGAICIGEQNYDNKIRVR